MDFMNSPYIYIAGVSLLILAAVAYFGYLKYTEITQKAERIETNLRKVIDVVNDITDKLNEADQVPSQEEHPVPVHVHTRAAATATLPPKVPLAKSASTLEDITEETSDDDSVSFDGSFDDDVSDDETDTASEPVVIQLGKNSTCTYVLEGGKRRGQPCMKSSPKRTGYCPSHQDKVPVPLD